MENLINTVDQIIQRNDMNEIRESSLAKACELAAKEIRKIAIIAISDNEIAAIIYKHMRDQREL